MSVDHSLHTQLHMRFQEAFGPPHHDLYDTEQWSLTSAGEQGAIHVLLNGTRMGPLVWVFDPKSKQNAARHFAVTQEEQIDDLIEQLKGHVAGAPQPPIRDRGRLPLLSDVLTTEQLAQRPSRPPGYAAENDALLALAQGMAHEPQNILQLAVDTAMQLCRGHSAVISIMETDGDTRTFRWVATAGAFAPLAGTVMPYDSPCKAALERNAILMLHHPERLYRFPMPVDPPIEEAIFAPFRAQGQPVGTLWVIAHTKDRKFDREDTRLLASVSHFAGAGYQIICATNKAAAGETTMTSARDVLVLRTDELDAIVAQRTKELVETHEKLRLSERMATMGTLSAGLGHDMGNMGLAMRLRLGMLRDLGEPSQEHVRVLGDCVSYLQNLARGLRLMAIDPADRRLGPEHVALAVWWEATKRVIASGVAVGIVVESDIPIDCPEVLINRAGLTQAMYNLVQNASDAMAGPNAIGIDKPVARGRIMVAAAVDESGSNVLLSVSDDGPGMTDEVRLRCLEPFFSTKTGSVSTGLGLSLVRAVTEAASGRINIESEPGRGTTFVLTLPMAKA